MKIQHSVRSMYASAGVPIVGNVAYLPNTPVSPQSLGKLVKWLPKQEWFKEICAKLRMVPLSGSRIAGIMSLEMLHIARTNLNRRYVSNDGPSSSMDTKLEPEWMGHLPPFVRRYLRCQYAIGDGIDPLAIVPKFPFMGFGYVIPDAGMACEASVVFHLHRLSQVKQLSFLHDPVLKENDRSTVAMMFGHTRYCHSLDAFTVANLISANIGLDTKTANTLLTAAISHDALTPAGGDSVKLIDPEAFDEDIHYPELLVGEDWEKYKERFGIDRDLLVRTILGEGLLGRILDIADKSSYTARDVVAYLGTGTPTKKDTRSTNLYAVADIVMNDPHICAVWESARCYNGSLVFRDGERLARFLKLRALMFRGLYCNPYSRFFEYMVGKGLVKYMYKNGMVTREELLEQGDWWIERKIDELLGAYMMLGRFHNLENARIEEYRDVESAKKRAHEFVSDESVITIVDTFTPSTNSAVKKFLVRKKRETVVFAKAYPDDAEEIEGIMTFPKVTRLYFFDSRDLSLPAEGCRKLKEIMSTVD